MKLSKRKLGFAVVGVLALASLPSFLEHVSVFLAGQLEGAVIEGRWDIVVLNVAVFLAVLLPLMAGMRWRVDWRSSSMGVYAAFIVSMFVEMYGVPLTVYMTAPLVSDGGPSLADQAVWVEFTFLGQYFAMTFWKVVGLGITILGVLLVGVGWTTLYRSDDDLVTSGLYGYSRHPQYVGIFLVVFGWFVHWPSFLTLALLPVLAYFYRRLAIQEEQEVMESFDDPEPYREYMERTPRFV